MCHHQWGVKDRSLQRQECLIHRVRLQGRISITITEMDLKNILETQCLVETIITDILGNLIFWIQLLYSPERRLKYDLLSRSSKIDSNMSKDIVSSLESIDKRIDKTTNNEIIHSSRANWNKMLSRMINKIIRRKLKCFILNCLDKQRKNNDMNPILTSLKRKGNGIPLSLDNTLKTSYKIDAPTHICIKE